ncbi:TPA: hypothetical protein G9F27_005304 [Salmonella enterica]|uniref:XRE family transcriptional regulator n=1 Tax=Salmonella enterica TaxID=28901 RepID=A0A743SSQ0_SALER|nr:hypothetical protein [Salmonella enterica]
MPEKNHNLFLCNDSTLTSMQRLLKEKKRLSISDDQMAKILGVPEFSSVSASSECPDFPVGELPSKVRAGLLNAGVDLFYIFAGVSADSDEVTKMRMFYRAAEELSSLQQRELRYLIYTLPKVFVR